MYVQTKRMKDMISGDELIQRERSWKDNKSHVNGGHQTVCVKMQGSSSRVLHVLDL
jgi:hypothetical protein